MRVLLDTNVLLDFLLEREGFADSSADVVRAVERREHAGLLSPTSLTTVYYFLRKARGHEEASRCLRELLRLFAVAPVDHAVVAAALRREGGDFEDHVIAEAAIAAKAEAIITRDNRGFPNAGIPVMTPAVLLALRERST